MGSNPLPDTFFSIKSKDFYKEKFIEMINLKPKEQIKPRKFKKRIFLIGHSYTTVPTYFKYKNSSDHCLKYIWSHVNTLKLN